MRRRHGAQPVGGAARAGRNGVERVSNRGTLIKLVKYYIRKELSDFVAAVLGLEQYHPITSKLSGHGSQTKRKKEKTSA